MKKIKDHILDTAADIVRDRGAAHLTYNALVKRTGLSKGGILYHFPSKKILLEAMVARMIDTFDTSRKTLSKKSSAKLPMAQTYILASLTKDKRSYKTDLSILAAAANDPELLAPLKEHYQQNFKEMRDAGPNIGLATLLYLATDGLWLLSALQMNFATPRQVKAMLETALQLAEGEAR